MFKSPILALCTNRDKKAKVHQTLGEPDAWLNDRDFESIGLHGIRSFEFFVDWNTDPQKVQPILWRKQIPSANFPDWKTTDLEGLLAALRTDTEFVKLVKFGLRNVFEVNAVIYDGEADWKKSGNTIRVVSIKSRTDIRTELLSLDALQERIKTMSGGPVSVGKKELIYGTTTLECMLSKTDAAWPGDVDLLITDNNYNPIKIVEFKKHTLLTDIGDQRLANYYPNPDQRKYRRLALFRDHLGLPDPTAFVCVYYPVQEAERRIKIEEIVGLNTNLRADGEIIVEISPRDLSGEPDSTLVKNILGSSEARRLIGIPQ